MSVLCECGCGEPTRLSRRTDIGKGLRRGQPLRFVNGHQSRRNGFAAYEQNRLAPARTRHLAGADDRFIAYYTGAADARNGRPRRNIHDAIYNRGYDA